MNHSKLWETNNCEVKKEIIYKRIRKVEKRRNNHTKKGYNMSTWIQVLNLEASIHIFLDLFWYTMCP